MSGRYDVAIIGSDFAGSMLAAILAKHGVRVAVVGEQSPPNYAVASVTIPYTSVIVELIGERYGVPEIETMAYAKKVSKSISNMCGIKKSLGFLYHHEGQKHDANEAIQFNVPSEHGESHYFRQDIDAFLLNTAVRYGAEVHFGHTIDNIEIDGDGAKIVLSEGLVEADFVVDSSGEGSPLAKQFNLREEPTRLKHACRAMYTHMVDVREYDDCVARSYGNPGKWSEGTLHHIFDGGWIEVASFGNHPGSNNPLTSVSLHLDPKTYPANDMSAAAEFEAIVSKHPGIAIQFEKAKAVRPWLKNDAVQYSSKTTIGERFVLLDTAASFSDLLFGRALNNAVEFVHALAAPLLEAVHRGDYSKERFEYFDQVQQEVIDWNDRVLHAAYIATRDFNLWNAFDRCWLLTSMICTLTVRSRHKAWSKTKDDAVLKALSAPVEGGYWYPLIAPIRQLLDTVIADVEKVDSEGADPKAVAETIFGYLRDGAFVPPVFDFADPKAKIYNLNLPRQLRTVWWLLTAAPAEVKELTK